MIYNLTTKQRTIRRLKDSLYYKFYRFPELHMFSSCGDVRPTFTPTDIFSVVDEYLKVHNTKDCAGPIHFYRPRRFLYSIYNYRGREYYVASVAGVVFTSPWGYRHAPISLNTMGVKLEPPNKECKEILHYASTLIPRYRRAYRGISTGRGELTTELNRLSMEYPTVMYAINQLRLWAVYSECVDNPDMSGVSRFASYLSMLKKANRDIFMAVMGNMPYNGQGKLEEVFRKRGERLELEEERVEEEYIEVGNTEELEYADNDGDLI